MASFANGFNLWPRAVEIAARAQISAAAQNLSPESMPLIVARNKNPTTARKRKSFRKFNNNPAAVIKARVSEANGSKAKPSVFITKRRYIIPKPTPEVEARSEEVNDDGSKR